MTNDQLIEIAFDWAILSEQAGKVANDLQKLMEYGAMGYIHPKDIELLSSCRQIAIRVHYEHSASSLRKELPEIIKAQSS